MRIVSGRIGKQATRGSELLAAYLRRTGATHEAAAAKAGVLSSLITRWLHGDRRPGLEAAFAMQRAFGIPAEAWLKGASERFALHPTRTGT